MGPEAIAVLLGAMESAATVVALGVGGVWTYMLFVRKRQKYPRATMAQSVMVRRLSLKGSF